MLEPSSSSTTKRRRPMPPARPPKWLVDRLEEAFVAGEIDEAALEARKAALVRISRWSPATRRWWRTWCDSEQTAQFSATDWQRLEMLAPLVDQYFAEPTKELLGEIRLNEAKLGATAEDRQRLRWTIKTGDPQEEAAAPAPRSSRSRGDPRLHIVDDA